MAETTGIEEMLIEAYIRGVIWERENPEAGLEDGATRKAARDYADKVMTATGWYGVGELVSTTTIERMRAHIGPPSVDLAVSFRTDRLHSILSEILSRRCVDAAKEAKLDRQNKALIWCMARLKHRSYVTTLAGMVGIDPIYPPPEHETIIQSGNT